MNVKEATIAWIAVDWGTTNVRAWAIGSSGEILARSESGQGMAMLAPDQFEGALLDIIAEWLPAKPEKKPIDVIACGMVGAKQGWREAAYESLPWSPVLGSESYTMSVVEDPRFRVHILPGLKQFAPADVMRGEETQISGFLRSDPGFSGVICLPGTHTKWALIKRGVVEFFTTFMTGELFSFLEKQSVLKHSFSSEGWNGNAFKTAVNYAISKPEKISSRLFSLRAGGLISDLDPVAARSMASGYLIGLEMAAMKDLWRENKICLIGASALTKIYVSAFHEIGVETADYDVETMTLAGLAQAYSNLSQSEKCTG